MNSDDFEILFTTEDYLKMEQKCQTLQEQVRNYQQEIKESKDQLTIVTKKNSDLEQEITKINKNMDFLSSKSLQLSQALIDREAKNQQLEKQYQDTLKCLEEELSGHNHLKIKYDELFLENQKVVEQLSLQMNKQTLNSAVQTLNKFSVDSSVQTSLTEHELNQKDEEIAAAGQQKNILVEEVAQLQKTIKMLQTQLLSFQTSSGSMQQKIMTLSEQLQMLNSKIMQSQCQIEELKVQNQELKTINNDIQRERKQLQKIANDQAAQNENLRSNVKDRQKKIQVLSCEIAQLNQSMLQVIQKNEVQKISYKQLLSQKDLLDTQMDNYSTQISQLQVKTNVLKQDIIDRQNEVNVLKIEMDLLKSQNFKLNQALEINEKEMEEMLQKSVFSSKKSKTGNLESLKKQIETYFSNMAIGLMQMGGIQPKDISLIVQAESKQLMTIIKDASNVKALKN